MDEDHKEERSKSETDSLGQGRANKSAGQVTGRRLGEFQLISEIASGGMGSVYEAFDTAMQRRVALKVLHPSLSLSQSSQQRFLREAWIAGRVNHPNIIKVHSRGEAQGYLYLAMEYAEGGSLRDQIYELKKRVDAGEQVREVADSAYLREMTAKFVGLAEALEHVHGEAFIHRDIKPHNILISGDERLLKLTDFGIAHSDDMTRMTKAGDFMGTVRYMSPELIAAHRTEIDRRSDIYSLGVTLYEALTLKLPYEGDTDEKLIGEILAGRGQPARRRNPCIPRDLETVLLKAMQPDPAKRYQSTAALADDLRRVLESRPISARREGALRKMGKFLRRHRREMVFAFPILLVGFSLLYWYYRAETGSLRESLLVSTLKQAVLSKRHPATFEPDWDALSARLRETIGQPDALSARWYYLQTCAVSDLTCPRFAVRKHAAVTLSCYSLDVLNKADESTPLGAVVVEWQVAADEEDYTAFGSVYQLVEAGMGQARSTMTVMLSDLDSTLESGPHNVRIRTIATGYWGGVSYSTFPFSASCRDTVVAGPDTLYSMDGCVFGEGKPDFVRMLSIITHEPIRPLETDTEEVEMDVWLFEQYPDNFPRLASDESGEPWWQKRFRIEEMEIRALGDTACETILRGNVVSREVPSLAMKLIVLNLSKGDTLLTGFFASSGRDGTCRVAYDDALSSWRGSWRKDPDDSSQQVITLLTSMTKSLSRARDTSAGPPIAARLRLEPSQEVGRRFGDDDEIYGLPIEMDVLFSVTAD